MRRTMRRPARIPVPLRLPPVLPVLLAISAAALAGCGSGGSTSARSAATTAAAPVATAPVATTPTVTATTQTAPPPKPKPKPKPGSAVGREAVVACRQIVSALSSLPASTRTRLDAICAKAASGDVAEIRRAAERVCIEATESSAVPQAVRERALQACKAPAR